MQHLVVIAGNLRCDHPGARGRLGGRPKAKMLDTPKKVTLAQSLYENRNNTIDEICKTLNVSRATLYRYIKAKATP